MDFVPYRELRNEPAALRKKLQDKGDLVVTVNGKPFAVMVDLSNCENMDEVQIFLSRLRLQMAIRSVRSKARRDGLDKLSEKEIEEEIQKARAERNAKC
ncbi:MAG: type II toxin-antitoxin system prevent-host-death family antitoxin [Chloroflexi bacterium]|nr:type II toxin-antitoxin system prevent-host-death family antitoxin [Chloroflexota bacterium]